MKLANFLKLFENYPEDCEVYLSFKGIDNTSKVFKTCQYNGDVIVCGAPDVVEDIPLEEETTENTVYNMDDSFRIYSFDKGDIIEYKHGQTKIKYENKATDNETDNEYTDLDLSFVGGLRDFLEAFPEDMPINIHIDGHPLGIINKIQKTEFEYYTHVYPDGDVGTEMNDELIIEYGIPLYNGNSLPLKDSTPNFWEHEVERVIAEPIIDYFTQNGKHTLQEAIGDEGNLNWGILIEEIRDNIYKYYQLHYRINGGMDSNGKLHLYDENETFKKPVKIEKENQENN